MAKKRKDSTDIGTADPKQAFLITAMHQWRTADSAEGSGEGTMRYEGKLDLQFLNLQQWSEDAERDRRASDKPALVIDQIGEPYRQLTGQLRRAKPSIQINPVDNGADVDTAEILQGLYRHVEVTGNAKAARDEAAKGMCGPGWGYYRLITEYEYDQDVPPRADGTYPPEFFDQCIKFQPIENQFTVFRDPACPLHEPWKARFCLLIEAVPTDTFKQKWPNATATSQDAFQALGISMPEWFPEGSVWVADYFYVEEKEGPPVALLADGRVVPLELAPNGVAILQQRRPTIRTVKLAKITACEILDGNEDKTAGRDFECDFIPVIPMYGESLVVDGKRTLRGIVRAARDPQRMYNYQNSELVYELAISPKSKALLPFGGDEDLKQMWKEAPVKAFPALYYNAFDSQGRPLPPPTVAQFTDPTKIQAITIAINQHKADLRSTTGWYDSTDPSRKNTDQSGRAILARKEAQAEGAVNYMENYSAALRFEAMCGLSMIKRLYNRVGRVLRIVGLEDQTETKAVTYGKPLPRTAVKNAQKVQTALQWGTGRYDITVDIGAGHSTRRQEAAEAQIELMKVLPETMAAAMAPQAVRNMDWPGARETADRLERTLPPEIRGDDAGQDDPAALKQQVQQAQMQMQEMGQVIQGLQEAVKTDQVKAEADLQKTQQSDAVKLRIEEAKLTQQAAIEREKIQAELAKAQMQIDADFQLAQMKIEADLEKTRITAQAAAQARREGVAADHMQAEVAHRHTMEESAATGNGASAQ
jgi:hypothetical protein